MSKSDHLVSTGQKRRDYETEKERKERKKRKKEEKRALKVQEATGTSAATGIAKASSIEESNESTKGDTELMKEKKERKRKRKEEKRALQSNQADELIVTEEIVQPAHNIENQQDANLDQASKEERRSAKKMKKLMRLEEQEKVGEPGVDESTDIAAEKQDESSREKRKGRNERDLSKIMTSEKKQKNQKNNTMDVAEVGEAPAMVESEKLPPELGLSQNAGDVSSMPPQRSKYDRKNGKMPAKKQRKENEADSLPVKTSSTNETEPSTEEVDAASILTSLKGKGKELKELPSVRGECANESSDMSSYENLGSKSRSSTKSQPKRNISAMIDAALRRKVIGGPSNIRTSKDKKLTSSAHDGGSNGSEDTKEMILADAKTLTHKQMLVDKLYRGHQLKWLQEAVGLKVKQGAFSSWEQDKLQEAIQSFKEKKKMSDEDFTTWINSSAGARDEKEAYALFWRDLTASVEDRPNRAVRVFVKRMLKPKKTGSWSDEELTKLKLAVKKHGKRWQDVANEVTSRTAEDCRLRWRDYSDSAMKNRKKGDFTDKEIEEMKEVVASVCEEEGIDMTSASTVIPWKTISEKLGGTRKPGTYAEKWQWIHQSISDNAEKKFVRGVKRWTQDDTRKLVALLSEQERALEKDDFTEVNLRSLKREDFKVSSKAMSRTWRELVSKCASSEEYKLNFRSNLEKVKKGIANGNAFKKRPNKSPPARDFIDSDEEV